MTIALQEAVRPRHFRPRGRSPWSVPALLLLLTAPASPQALLQGLVEIVEDDQRLPVSEAVVRAFVEGEAIAVARSDREGSYAIEVPAESFELRLDKPGYVVATAAGLDQPRLRRTCPPAGDCGQVDFLLERAAAVEVWLADPSGDPFPNARVELALTDGDRETSAKRATDDRGVSRFHGLPPGRYRADVHVPMLHPNLGNLYAIDPAEVELRPGENAPLYLSARRAAAFSFSAVIEDIDFEEQRHWIQVRPLRAGASSQGWSFRQSGPELRLPRLAEGDYVLELKARGGGDTRVVSLGRIKVDGNVSGLVLRPKPLPTLLVHVLFEDGAPDAARLALRSSEGWTWGAYGILRGKVNFTISDAPPGRYTLISDRSDAFLLDEPAIQLAEGSVESIRVTLSARFARIRGAIRGGGAGGPVRVELAGPAATLDRTIGPDGAFSFGKLAPGEYALCASRAGASCPEDRWRRFQVEAGDDIELEVGAPE